MMKNTQLIFATLLFLILGLSSTSHAQFLNPNFATNGYTQDVLSYGRGAELIVQPDNKILVANQRRAYYANTTDPDKNYLYCNRYNEDGSLDNSFGNNGIARIPHYPETQVFAMGLQANGKVLLAGESKYCGNITCGWKNLVLGQLNADGSVDLNFGTNGTVAAEELLGPAYLSSRISTVETLSNGKIIISGVGTISTDGTTANYAIRPFVARLNSDGSFDTTFGNGTGITYINQAFVALMQDMLFAADGSIFLLFRENYHSGVLKLSASGVVDTNFGNGGVQIIDIGTTESTFVSFDMRDDSKLVLGGYVENSTLDSSVVIIMNPDGSMYNGVNQIFIDVPMDNGRINAVKCVSNNQTVIAGTLICDTTSFNNEARLGFVGLVNEDGTYDNSFSTDGIITFNLAAQGNWNRTLIEDMTVLDNGDILCTGGRFATPGSTKSQLLLLSLNSNGTIQDQSSLTSLSNISGLEVYPNPLSTTSVLSYVSKSNEDVSIDLFDLSGRHIHSYFQGVPKLGMNTVQLTDRVNIAEGNYLIKVTSGTGVQTIQVRF